MGNAIGGWFERDVIQVTGPDAARFLQGQVSQDVEGLATGAAAWSLVLDPSGHLVAWVRVHRVAEEAFELDVDAGWSGVVVARLDRFRIRVACEISELAGRRMLVVRGSAPDGVDGALVAPGSSVGVVGFDLIGDDDLVEPDGLVLDPDAVEAHRVAHGIPAMGSELDDTVIPAEIGRWFVEEAVSWSKGCYTGQELVARVDSRGANTPRRLRSLTLTGPASLGDEVLVDGVSVGAVTSVFGSAALARIARAVVPPADGTVGGAPAAISSIAGTEPPPAVVEAAADAAARRRSLI